MAAIAKQELVSKTLEGVLGKKYEIIDDTAKWRDIFEKSGIERFSGLLRQDFRSKSRNPLRKDDVLNIVADIDKDYSIRFRNNRKVRGGKTEFTLCKGYINETPIDINTSTEKIPSIISAIFAPDNTRFFDRDVGFQLVSGDFDSVKDPDSGILYTPICLQNIQGDKKTALVLLFATRSDNRTVHGFAFMAQGKT